jgi:hypothetical protein
MADAADREQKRERDREWARRRRAAQGARPHAESLSRKKPWLLVGQSRRTWERKRAAKTSAVRAAKTSFHPLLTEGVRTDEFASTVRAENQLGPTSRPERRAEYVEREGGGRTERVTAKKGVVVSTNGQHCSRLQRALERRRTAEDELVSNVVHLKAVSLG